MMKKHFFLSVLFIASCFGDFAGILLDEKWLDYLSKPIILISIGGFFLVSSGHISKRIVMPALVAFTFSWFGDVFMMFSEKEHFFILGLLAFLFAQLSYIFLFRRTVKIAEVKSFLSQKPYWLTVYLVFGGLIYSLMFNRLDPVMRIAVFVYMVALLSMSAMALNRYNISNKLSFLLVFLGSVLFVISDSIIALNRFLTPIPNSGLLIMSTYIAAQYLIMRGLLKQFENAEI